MTQVEQCDAHIGASQLRIARFQGLDGPIEKRLQLRRGLDRGEVGAWVARQRISRRRAHRECKQK